MKMMTTSGFDALDRQLARMSRGPSPKAKMAALMAGGEIIADEARSIVHVVSGNLRDSITVSPDPLNFSNQKFSQNGTTVYVGPAQGKGKPHDGFYGHMVENGTFRSAAYPFMRPAIDAKAEQAGGLVMSMLLADMLGGMR